MTADPLLAGGVAAAVAGAGGLLVPWVLARLPEPPPDDADDEPDTDEAALADPDEPVPGVGGESDTTVPPRTDPLAESATPVAPPRPPKVPYAELAARPRLGLWCALAGLVVGGVVGAGRGWEPDLPVWIYLSALGVLLAYVDWQTRLLPTRLVAPSYGVVAALLLVAFAVERDVDQLVRATIAWVAVFAVYFLLWFVYPRGLGYGDVRLSGVLGMALGWLSWTAVVVGMYSGFLLGGIVGGVLALLRVVDRRGYPFGPFMLVGVVLGVLVADGDWALWS